MLDLHSDSWSQSSQNGFTSVLHRPTSSYAEPTLQMQTDDCDGETLAARYQMLEELGSGSFGVVYKAIERSTGEIVAVKHVDLESSEEDLSDILSELSVLSSCASSHVTKYKLAFLRRQTLWIVMEYLGGGSCADLLKPPPHCIPETHIAIICRELLIGLDYLHREGKLHRDIKAANVLLGRDGRVKLADFGVAAQLVGLKSLRNTFVGTPFWMAPEVIQQEGHDSKADIWSLGITAMELANGEPPHAHVHPMKVLFQIPKQSAPRLEGPTWSKEFRDFVAQCLTKDPDRRVSAKELLRHKFIKNAGKVEALQELILKKQEWDSNKGAEKNLKYYAETLRTLEVDGNDDDWVFDTIKAAPAPNMGTSRRTKAERTSIDPFEDELSQNMSRMSLERLQTGTMRRVAETEKHEEEKPKSPGYQQNTKKRLSSIQPRNPLGVNMSFGNSPSTVRQFKRTSSYGESQNSTAEVQEENKELDTGSVIHTPQKSKPQLQQLQVVSNPFMNDSEMMPPPPTPSPSKRSLQPLQPVASSSPTKNSRFSTASTLAEATRKSSTSSTASDSSKEAILGRRLYSKAIGISCQEVLDNTADASRREAVAKLAESFSDLESADPEGMYAIMSAIFSRVKEDKKMMTLIPPLAAMSQAPSLLASRVSSVASTASTTSTSPKKEPFRGPGSRLSTPLASPTKPSSSKLVMAQNNPHLQSHHRRQSTQSHIKTSTPSTPTSPAPSRSPSKGVAPSPSRSPSKVSALSKEEVLKRRGSRLESPTKARADDAAERARKEREARTQAEIDAIKVGGQLDHTKLLAEGMFSRWCEGVAVRWAGVQ
ncbi:uncharacterized protein HMPREF1541_08961 [Cyphellophora europaea CBS 101466]|uniref:non-specific serine/threonine protein kinase n=1 Tax=Cyphellophora europaea (strain CBS 101466) TaxID=1220924 RepID=W2RLU6_CYPE1|nr:uncharacterized protein HMPREF1541_08961 [Cyphellophora europaea CBS 101466]ETN36683.1 hypothetical protein HMPREF1541_08961 [Cyphellophora europaea CBS 101466]